MQSYSSTLSIVFAQFCLSLLLVYLKFYFALLPISTSTSILHQSIAVSWCLFHPVCTDMVLKCLKDTSFHSSYLHVLPIMPILSVCLSSSSLVYLDLHRLWRLISACSDILHPLPTFCWYLTTIGLSADSSRALLLFAYDFCPTFYLSSGFLCHFVFLYIVPIWL